MAETIRRIEENDFEAVSALYNGRKSVKELKWLFTNPEDSTIYNAFVAENKNKELIGVCGYVQSIYYNNTIQKSGVIPISWKISSNYKGMAGVLLFKKILSQGDFGITIAGSETAQNLYSLFKFKNISKIDHFYKILDLQNTYKSLHRKSFIKTIGMFAYLLPSYFNRQKKTSFFKEVQLIKYDGVHYKDEFEIDSTLRKKTSKAYIDWLLNCPLLKTYAFSIKKGENYLGTCVLYSKEENKIKKGRIVHLPYLGDDVTIWKEVITKCNTFLKEEGCSIVSSLAHNKINQKGYLSSGFVKIKKHYKPLFIKDSKNVLESVDLSNWLLQYSESDKGYRDL